MRARKPEKMITGHRSGRGDIVPAAIRSQMMCSVRQRGTSPEMEVRRLVREVGGSYRLNSRSLPGSPDLSNVSRGWAIFVHGCFWHGHRNCRKTKGGKDGRIPVTRRRFWEAKLEENRRRDARKVAELRAAGLRVLTVWECELKNRARLLDRLMRFLLRTGGS